MILQKYKITPDGQPATSWFQIWELQGGTYKSTTRNFSFHPEARTDLGYPLALVEEFILAYPQIEFIIQDTINP